MRDLCPVVCPEVVTFDPTCCVGGALTTQVVLNNEGDRWMQSSLELTALRKDGVEVRGERGGGESLSSDLHLFFMAYACRCYSVTHSTVLG